MKYVCLCDLDNTLLNDKEELTPKTISMLNNYLAKGNKLVAVSYASYHRIKKLFSSHSLDADIVSLAEGLIEVNGKIITNPLPSTMLNQIIKEYKDDLYTFFGENEKRTYVYKYLERLKLFYPETDICKTSKLPDLFYATAIMANARTKTFKQRLSELGFYYQSLGVDAKREIIQIFAKELLGHNLLNILFNEYQDIKIIGIADSYYDYDKIKDCDITIAMLNGDEELKKSTNLVTSFDNNNDGAMKALNDICHFE